VCLCGRTSEGRASHLLARDTTANRIYPASSGKVTSRPSCVRIRALAWPPGARHNKAHRSRLRRLVGFLARSLLFFSLLADAHTVPHQREHNARSWSPFPAGVCFAHRSGRREPQGFDLCGLRPWCLQTLSHDGSDITVTIMSVAPLLVKFPASARCSLYWQAPIIPTESHVKPAVRLADTLCHLASAAA
jgi:hypothetical protein